MAFDAKLVIHNNLPDKDLENIRVDVSIQDDDGDVESKDAATASKLGGELTSLLKETTAHYLAHRVNVNLPGRDNLLDFLADTDMLG